MKTKGILIAMTLVIFTSLNFATKTSAQNEQINTDPINYRINIRVNQDNQVVLRAASFENQKWVNLILKVYSEDGEMVYAASMHKKDGIFKSFDMKNLPEGKYSFQVYKSLKMVYAKEVIKTSDIASTANGSKEMIVQEL